MKEREPEFAKLLAGRFETALTKCRGFYYLHIKDNKEVVDKNGSTGGQTAPRTPSGGSTPSSPYEGSGKGVPATPGDVGGHVRPSHGRGGHRVAHLGEERVD